MTALKQKYAKEVHAGLVNLLPFRLREAFAMAHSDTPDEEDIRSVLSAVYGNHVAYESPVTGTDRRNFSEAQIRLRDQVMHAEMFVNLGYIPPSFMEAKP